MADNLRVDLDDDDFGDYEYGQSGRAGVKDLSDIVETRVSNHSVISAICQEHYDINTHYNKDAIPILKQMIVSKIMVINEKHGYRIGDENHYDIKSQHPDPRQRIVGLFSEKEIADFKEDTL